VLHVFYNNNSSLKIDVSQNSLFCHNIFLNGILEFIILKFLNQEKQ